MNANIENYVWYALACSLWHKQHAHTHTLVFLCADKPAINNNNNNNKKRLWSCLHLFNPVGYNPPLSAQNLLQTQSERRALGQLDICCLYDPGVVGKPTGSSFLLIILLYFTCLMLKQKGRLLQGVFRSTLSHACQSVHGVWAMCCDTWRKNTLKMLYKEASRAMNQHILQPQTHESD